MNTQDFIDMYSADAINESASSGIPASIIMAQAILESSSGSSSLFILGNNSFGIKCAGGWSGATIYANDNLPNECFRAYGSIAESFADHSAFLEQNSRYASLFSIPITDYAGWASGLQNAGYATDQTYAAQLISLIQKYGLDSLDAQASTKKNIRLAISVGLVLALATIVIFIILKK